MPEPLVLVMAAFALLSAALLVAAFAALRKRRWIGTCMSIVLAVLFLPWRVWPPPWAWRCKATGP